MSVSGDLDRVDLIESEPSKHGRFQEVPVQVHPPILKNTLSRGATRRDSRRSSHSTSEKGEEGHSSRPRSSSRSSKSRSYSRQMSEDDFTSEEDRESDDSRARQSRGTRELFHALSRAAHVALSSARPEEGEDQMRKVKKVKRQLRDYDREKLMKLKRKDDEWAKQGINESNSKLDNLQKNWTIWLTP